MGSAVRSALLAFTIPRIRLQELALPLLQLLDIPPRFLLVAPHTSFSYTKMSPYLEKISLYFVYKYTPFMSMHGHSLQPSLFSNIVQPN